MQYVEDGCTANNAVRGGSVVGRRMVGGRLTAAPGWLSNFECQPTYAITLGLCIGVIYCQCQRIDCHDSCTIKLSNRISDRRHTPMRCYGATPVNHSLCATLGLDAVWDSDDPLQEMGSQEQWRNQIFKAIHEGDGGLG